jgi:hypothetical protein
MKPQVLLLLLWLVGSNASPADAKSYSAERFDSHIRVLTGGAIEVTETVVFRFEDGSLTYVFREIPRRRTDSVDVLRATMDGREFPIGDQPGQVEVERGSRLRVRGHFAAPVSDSIHTFTLAPPGSHPPAIAGALAANGHVSLPHAIAALFSLADRGEILIKEESRGMFGQRNFILERRRNARPLAGHEQVALELAFKDKQRDEERVSLARARSRLQSHFKGSVSPSMTRWLRWAWSTPSVRPCTRVTARCRSASS